MLSYPNRPDELVERAEEMVKIHMSKYDPSHDWAHVDRVRRLALSIAATMEPRPDMLVVELAALFHDLDEKYSTPDSPSLASLLSPYLTPQTISSTQSSLILQIIPSVSYTSELSLHEKGQWTWQNECRELHAVQDADRLDAIGSIGIFRVAAFSGAKGRLLVDNGDGKSAEGHFYEKLLLVKDRMKTPFGKEEAERRHQTMVDFLKALDREKALESEPES